MHFVLTDKKHLTKTKETGHSMLIYCHQICIFSRRPTRSTPGGTRTFNHTNIACTEAKQGEIHVNANLVENLVIEYNLLSPLTLI